MFRISVPTIEEGGTHDGSIEPLRVAPGSPARGVSPILNTKLAIRKFNTLEHRLRLRCINRLPLPNRTNRSTTPSMQHD